MKFNGSSIKIKTKEAGHTIQWLANELSVSRQTVNSWIGGQTPRGLHLVGLCGLLNVQPDFFFAGPDKQPISVPLHRTIKGKLVSAVMKTLSFNLAEQYLNLFRQAPSTTILPVVRIQRRSEEDAKVVVEFLRKHSGITEDKPMDYKSAFHLLAELGIYVIFRTFPEELKKNSYAFYSSIANQRVIFVNIDTSVLDLIFQLLHETVHAIHDEDPSSIENQEEESFCDKVAELAQFPDFYTNMISQAISNCKDIGTIINRLRDASKEHAHSLWGIYYRLLHKNAITLKDTAIAGAATNLTKSSTTLREIFFKNSDPLHFVDMLNALSPKFYDLISEQLPDCSTRKFGEWLGLDSTIDAQTVINEIMRRKQQV